MSYTYAEIKAMSPEELRATQKKVAKKLAAKIIVGAAVSVAVHFASKALIDMIENKQVAASTPVEETN